MPPTGDRNEADACATTCPAEGLPSRSPPPSPVSIALFTAAPLDVPPIRMAPTVASKSPTQALLT
jgi:hypothetical protein